jgi:putative transposase
MQDQDPGISMPDAGRTYVTLAIKPDQTFEFDGGTHRFIRELNGGRLLMQRESTGMEFPLSEDELIAKLNQGEARRIASAVAAAGKARKLFAGDELSPDEYDSPKGLKARSLQYLVKKFDDDLNGRKTRKYAAKLISRSKKEMMSKSLRTNITVFQLLYAIENFGTKDNRKLRYFLDKRGKSKRVRLPKKVDEFLNSAVTFFWDERERTHSDAFGYFHELLKAENDQRRDRGDAPLKPPKRMETLRKRITASICRENWQKKYSRFEADQKFRGTSPHLEATAPGEMVIIDHTCLDAFTLLDRESGLPLGRPYLSVAIDVATRCILGFLVTAEPPSLYTVTVLLLRINRSKDYIADLYPDIDRPWDSWIHPSALLLDNAWELTSPSTQDMLSDLGTEVIWAPIATPQYKAIGERMFHTLNTMLIHRLKGGVAHNITDRRRMRLDPSKDAHLTVEDLDYLITKTIVTYENERHEGIGAVPARGWKEKILEHGRRFIDDINALKSAIGQVDEVTITRAGARYKNMVFHDQARTTQILDDLTRLAAKRSQSDKTYASSRVKAKIKYNPADCSEIQVWNEATKRYVSLPNRDRKFSANLSFWAAKQIFEYGKKQDLEFTSDEQRWLARNELRKAYESLMPKKRLGETRVARRMLALEKPTLEDKLVVHTTAPGHVDGRGKAADIQLDILAQTRIDGARKPKGVRKNPGKQDQTRSRNKKEAKRLVEANASKPRDEAPRDKKFKLAAGASKGWRPKGQGFGARS